MDVLEIDAASNTGIDNVRDVIINNIGIKPARDRYKVFIIDEVHMLSGAAFNALLKTVEEPPPGVVFIMATTEEHKVPETIASRCQLFEFRTIATARIADRLRLIADVEKISISDEAIREISRAGEGSMRDAQSAFDQVISFAGEKIKTEDVEKALGIAGADVLARVTSGIAENKPAEALAIVDDLVMRGHNLRNFCRDVLGHLRDLLVVKVSGDPKLLESSSAQAAALQQQAALFSESDLVRFFHSLAETEGGLKDAANPRYQLEVGLVKLMEMRRLAPLGDLVERIAALEDALRTGKPPVERKAPQSAPAGGSRKVGARSASAAGSSKSASPSPGEEQQATNESPSLASSAPTNSIVDRIKSALEQKRRPRLVAILNGAYRVAIENDELFVEFTSDGKHDRDTLRREENDNALREACAEVIGRQIEIRVTIKEQTSEADQTMSPEEEEYSVSQQKRQAISRHPSVQQALRAFGGQIVDINLQ
jgi:DNA polymerase-3 subunit gamma/tau